MIHLTDSQYNTLKEISKESLGLEAKLSQMRHYLANKEGMSDSRITTILVSFYASLAEPTEAKEPNHYEVLGKLYHEIATFKHTIVGEFKDDTDKMKQLVSDAQAELREGKAIAELVGMLSKFKQ